MFELKITPDFAAQKRRFLAEKSVPLLALPPSLERCIEGISSARSVPGRSSVPGLWLDCLLSVRQLLLKAAAIATFASGCAASSTLAAMRILRSGPLAHETRTLVACAFAYFAMNCLAQAAVFHSNRLRAWVGLASESFLAGQISNKLLRLSSAAMARQSTGNLKILITSDVRNVGQFMDNLVRNLIPALAALAVITPLLLRFSGTAGAVGLSIMVLILPISLLLNRVSMHYQDKSQAALDRLATLAGEWVKNIRLIRYLSWQETFRHDVSDRVLSFMQVSMGQHFMACLIFGLGMSWWMISATGVVVASHWLGYPLDLIGFFGSLWLLTFLAGYFTHLPNTIRLYGQAAPSMARISRFLSEEEQFALLKPGTSLSENLRPVGVRFENVSYRYPQGSDVVRCVSLEIRLNRSLAVIGEIGSGKTTLLKMLCGEIPPSGGRVLVEFEGGEVRDLWTAEAYAAFRKCLAYVPQEPFVSSDLLSRNIALDESITDAAAMEAAYWAELEADITAFPQGVQQELGEGGVNLSGGQRQRLNLARAFHAKRPFLVLDDTLSAVDTKTETVLMQRLRKFADREGGFVLVTHRLAELMQVDQVVVMKDGALIELGDPRMLAADSRSHLTRALRAYDVSQPAEAGVAMRVNESQPAEAGVAMRVNESQPAEAGVAMRVNESQPAEAGVAMRDEVADV